jgi:hypothetical protein
MRAVQEPEAVDVDHLPPLVGIGAFDRAEQHHAGVVDEAVQAAQLLACALDERARAGLVGDVRLDRDSLASVVADPRRERLDPVRAAGAESHLRARLDARERGRLADAR